MKDVRIFVDSGLVATIFFKDVMFVRFARNARTSLGTTTCVLLAGVSVFDATADFSSVSFCEDFLF